MKNIILVIFILLQTSFLFSQGNEIIINDDSQYGFSRPRIALLDNDIPFVLWGKTGGSPKVYGAKLVGANFSTPVQIVPDSMRPRVGGLDGPNIVSHKDSVYVVWGNQDMANHHVFLSRSFDGGNSFGSAIQTDSLDLGENIEYPGISMNNDGTLGLYFIKSDPSWNNPTQSLITSYDRGNTFSKDSVVNSFSPGLPCECCQGSMEMQDSNWVFYYRNNVSNIRNTYSLVSTDYGNNFDGVYEMDDDDWFIQSCPSSGPEGHIVGDNSFVAWMSRGSGNTRVLFSSVNMLTGVTSPATYIDPNVSSSVVQNYPSVAGSGDTIAVVWQDNRYLASSVFTSISIDGGQSFMGTTLISDTTVLMSYTSIDVAFANGVFHYVWKNNNKIFYKNMTIPLILSASTDQADINHFSLFPNPASTELTIETELKVEKLSIIDIRGEIIKSFIPSSKIINVEVLPDGIYFIKIEGDDKSFIRKFIKR
tara:strand:+ start:6259 stop:7692 length:1434 start_codon:yes stop_codon:yes gene_type:complete